MSPTLAPMQRWRQATDACEKAAAHARQALLYARGSGMTWQQIGRAMNLDAGTGDSLAWTAWTQATSLIEMRPAPTPTRSTGAATPASSSSPTKAPRPAAAPPKNAATPLDANDMPSTWMPGNGLGRGGG